MSPDRTIAWDTLAFALYRISHCVLCGAAVPVEIGEAPPCPRCGEAVSAPWGSVWQCADEDSQRVAAVAFLVCHKHICRQSDHRSIEAEVDGKLRQRYGFAP